MSTQKRKFELFARLQALGFTYEESAALRRIEMTLQRWSEMECGNDYGHIFRDETTGKPFHQRPGYSVYGGKWVDPKPYAIADREAGALRRLGAIVDARNARAKSTDSRRSSYPGHVFSYHQGDPRGCSLYLITRAQITQDGKLLSLDQYYTRGLAVCA